MRVLMLMIVIMRMLVCRCYFGLLGSLIRLCHLSRGQIHAFQEASLSVASFRNALTGAFYASLLLYEASIERVKPCAKPDHSSKLKPVI